MEPDGGARRDTTIEPIADAMHGTPRISRRRPGRGAFGAASHTSIASIQPAVEESGAPR